MPCFKLCAQLLGFALCIACALPLQVVVHNSTEFFSAVAEFGVTGEDTVMLLQPSPHGIFSLNQTLTDVKMPESSDAFSRGQLIVTGGAESNVVLDTVGLGNITERSLAGEHKCLENAFIYRGANSHFRCFVFAPASTSIVRGLLWCRDNTTDTGERDMGEPVRLGIQRQRFHLLQQRQ